MSNLEIEILNKIREIITPFLDTLFTIFTYLGGKELIIIMIIVIYFIISKKDGQKIAYTIFLSLLSNNAIKVIVNRIRPFNHPKATYKVNDTAYQSATGMSFPSGHSQNASVSYLGAARIYKKKKIWIIASILVFLVCISRIMLGVHYPTDVLSGAILGIFFVYFGMNLYQKWEKENKQIILNIVTAIVFLPFIFIYLKKLNTNYLAYKDLYTIYSFYLGYIIAIYLENKYVNFNEDISLKIRIYRAIVSLIIVLIIQLGLKTLFPKDKVFFDMLRYFLISFLGIGIYPIVFKNIFFKTKEVAK